jgi:hypothetical protein
MGAANPPPSNGRLARKWGRLFLLVAYEQAPAGPTGALSYFLGNAQLLDGEMLGASTTCRQEVWKIFPIFRKCSRMPHDVFDCGRYRDTRIFLAAGAG